MPIRRLNGTSDHIDVAIGAADLQTSAYTAAAVIRMRNDSVYGAIFAQHGTGRNVALERHVANALDAESSGAEVLSPELTLKEADGWCLAAVTKAAGVAKPHFYKIALPSKTVSKAEGESTLGNASGASTLTRIGAIGEEDFLKADLAALAFWKRQMTDVEVEALATASGLELWLANSPASYVDFRQKSVAEEVKDLTGGGADQIAISGTESINEEPPIPYVAAAPARHNLALLGVGS